LKHAFGDFSNMACLLDLSPPEMGIVRLPLVLFLSELSFPMTPPVSSRTILFLRSFPPSPDFRFERLSRSAFFFARAGRHHQVMTGL